MTHPTLGLGSVVYKPRSAKRVARAMYSWSFALKDDINSHPRVIMNVVSFLTQASVHS